MMPRNHLAIKRPDERNILHGLCTRQNNAGKAQIVVEQRRLTTLFENRVTQKHGQTRCQNIDGQAGNHMIAFLADGGKTMQQREKGTGGNRGQNRQSHDQQRCHRAVGTEQSGHGRGGEC